MARKLLGLFLCLWLPSMLFASTDVLLSSGVTPPDTVNILELRLLPPGTEAVFQGYVTRTMGDYTFIEDGSAGITIRQTSSSFKDSTATGVLHENSMVWITGKTSLSSELLLIDQTETTNDLTSWSIYGQMPPGFFRPLLIPAGIVNMHGETHESKLVRVNNLQFVNETDEFFQPSKTYRAFENGDINAVWVDIRIGNMADTDVDGTPIPKNRFDCVGILVQHSTTMPNAGYFLLPIKTDDIFYVVPQEWTRNVVFGVNMSLAMHRGAFNPDSHHVWVRGSFNNFELADTLSRWDTTGVFFKEIPIIGAMNETREYKFFSDAPELGWEGFVGPAGQYGNRLVVLGPPDVTMPLEIPFFNNDMEQNYDRRIVEFVLNMSIMQAEGHFQPQNGDEITISGDFNGWGSDSNATLKVREDGLYTTSYVVYGPQDLRVQYKYRIVTANNRWLPNNGWEDFSGMRSVETMPMINRELILDKPGIDMLLAPVYFNNRSVSYPPLVLRRAPVNTDITKSGEVITLDIFVGSAARPLDGLLGVGLRLQAPYPFKFVGVEGNPYGYYEPDPLINAMSFVQYAPDSSWVDISKTQIPQYYPEGFGHYTYFARVLVVSTDSLDYWNRYQIHFQNVMAINFRGEPVQLDISPGIQFRILGPEVWPGDTDISGLVDMSDILPLGQYYGMMGPMRPEPYNMTWRGVRADSWMIFGATHADAIGDGVVNQNDLLPIGLNYGKYRINNPLPTKRFAKAIASTTVENLRAGDKVRLTLTPNTSNMAEMRILGAAFGVRIPSELKLNTITESEWFTHQEMLRFNHTDATTNMLGFAATRRNSNGAVTLSGDLMTVEFTVLQDVTLARFELENAIVSTPTTLENSVAFTLSAVIEHTSATEENRSATFALHQNIPNPFNPTTSISYEIETAGFVRLSVYNVVGQEVAVLVNGNKAAGLQTTTFDAAKLSSGLYFYKLTSGGQTAIRKMTLVK